MSGIAKHCALNTASSEFCVMMLLIARAHMYLLQHLHERKRAEIFAIAQHAKSVLHSSESDILHRMRNAFPNYPTLALEQGKKENAGTLERVGTCKRSESTPGRDA